MKKKKMLIAVIIVVVLIILTIAIVAGVANRKAQKEPINNNENNVDNAVIGNVKVTGKLKQYIEGLGNNYYIKYSGNFKNTSGELVSSIIEYTKSGENFGLRSTELDMQMVCEGEKLYSISNKYKMIVEMGRESFNISEYNLASDIGQIFVKSYKEKIGSTEYDVEEYSYNGKAIKYYFSGSDIKLISYNGEDIKIIRLEKNTNKELLVKPTNYTYVIA